MTKMVKGSRCFVRIAHNSVITQHKSHGSWFQNTEENHEMLLQHVKFSNKDLQGYVPLVRI